MTDITGIAWIKGGPLWPALPLALAFRSSKPRFLSPGSTCLAERPGSSENGQVLVYLPLVDLCPIDIPLDPLRFHEVSVDMFTQSLPDNLIPA